MDVLWDGRELSIAGPDTRAKWHPMAAGDYVVGVRFEPGHGARWCGASAEALRDARVPLAELWGDDALLLRDQLAAADDPQQALIVLERAVAARPASGADRLVQAVVQHVSTASDPRVATLARELGVSERQLLRRCRVALGYGPKFLARVLRFQRFMRALRSQPTRSLSELALVSGYTDQAHLGHEVSELAGVTPGRLRAELHPSSTRGAYDRL